MPTVRRAETRDADAVLALLEGLGRPEVAEDPSGQRAVFVDPLFELWLRDVQGGTPSGDDAPV